MRVIGIDIHPGKKSTLFNGNEYLDLDSSGLKEFLLKIGKNNNKNTLICCDAPLTGPRDIDNDITYKNSSNSLTKRDIEYFFTNNFGFNVNIKNTNTGEKKFKGISVGNYSSLPHWTITKRLFGLPIMGRYCKKDIPFKHIHSKEEISDPFNNYIVEVHPGLAIWIWLNKKWMENYDWEYKSKKNEMRAFNQIKTDLDCLFFREVNIDRSIMTKFDQIDNDDKLDSFIAWMLGYLWLKDSGLVNIIGNVETGSFLLPVLENLKSSFDDFVNNRKSNAYNKG
jgi:hypothetical protein